MYRDDSGNFRCPYCERAIFLFYEAIPNNAILTYTGTDGQQVVKLLGGVRAYRCAKCHFEFMVTIKAISEIE